MRGADSYNAALFSTVKLDEFVSQTVPLCPIRKWMNEADVKGGRPSMAPEKLTRAMLLHVLYSAHSERQIVKQMPFKLLFRWFVGLSIEAHLRPHALQARGQEVRVPHSVLKRAEHVLGSLLVWRGVDTLRHKSARLITPLSRQGKGHVGVWAESTQLLLAVKLVLEASQARTTGGNLHGRAALVRDAVGLV